MKLLRFGTPGQEKPGIVDAHGGSIKMRDKGTDGVELCLLLPCDEINESFSD